VISPPEYSNYGRVIFPSSQRRGGCAIKRMPRSDRSGAAGVVRPAQRFAELTTPALRATPPLRGGECAPPIRHRNYEKQYLGGELFFLFYRSTCPNCLVIVCSFRGGADLLSDIKPLRLQSKGEFVQGVPRLRVHFWIINR